ncbi:hypothetical protein [Rhodanobacter fulvus]|uniref:hypothetical protein n=1 Tax=Rhodanobacter fulvus TaxID=219571 RepID=UPI0012EA6BE4|nr:hypothetical protein [Rhodanobacter fulvus]
MPLPLLVNVIDGVAGCPARFCRARKQKGPHWAGLLAYGMKLQLRAGPPMVGVIIRAIIIATDQHTRTRQSGGVDEKTGGLKMHAGQ